MLGEPVLTTLNAVVLEEEPLRSDDRSGQSKFAGKADPL